MTAERNAWWRLAWAAPASLLGLLLAALLALAWRGARWRRIRGTLEIAPRRGHARLPFAAITLGHVIVGASTAELTRLRAHERVHVRQFERWGALMLLAYPLASLWVWLRGGKAYWDNPFEREARRQERG